MSNKVKLEGTAVDTRVETLDLIWKANATLDGVLKGGCRTNGFKNYRDAYSFAKSLLLYLPSCEAGAGAAYLLCAARRHCAYVRCLASATRTTRKGEVRASRTSGRKHDKAGI